MSIITISKNDHLQAVDFQNIENQSHAKQIELFNQMDRLFIDINKYKYLNGKQATEYIKKAKMPNIIDKNKITLLALMDFFQKRYVFTPFCVDLSRYPKSTKDKLGLDMINITSKINNFPHLIGISGIRDDFGVFISKVKPRDFLDGVLYQWILLNSYDDYKLDFEKLEVISWIAQTLVNPTYILLGSAIVSSETKFNADIIFIRKVMNSNKYDYHIVGLKKESDNNFAFKSQFPISKHRYYRFKKMFDLKKAIYDFYKVPR